ncbi:hypothetical protein F0U44_02775 [Nocardioides humilatus]|uniref:Uncharacterized protein n=1 Tax=Nocardioides humilatus TaxID=2607660 RepID=A0A5B1LL05_9ACTN|nr:hypothetical protein [Nocardioides humilatus]KAA1421253.1 hypothetical protein F0U44_02775 [Nocardioides humilatus]
MLTPHPSQTVLDPDGHSIEVDAGLAPVLAALWDAGVRTRYSCEGRSNAAWPGAGERAYIAMIPTERVDDLVTFLRIRDGEVGWAWHHDASGHDEPSLADAAWPFGFVRTTLRGEDSLIFRFPARFIDRFLDLIHEFSGQGSWPPDARRQFSDQ